MSAGLFAQMLGPEENLYTTRVIERAAGDYDEGHEEDSKDEVEDGEMDEVGPDHDERVERAGKKKGNGGIGMRELFLCCLSHIWSY